MNKLAEPGPGSDGFPSAAPAGFGVNRPDRAFSVPARRRTSGDVPLDEIGRASPRELRLRGVCRCLEPLAVPRVGTYAPPPVSRADPPVRLAAGVLGQPGKMSRQVPVNSGPSKK